MMFLAGLIVGTLGAVVALSLCRAARAPGKP